MTRNAIDDAFKVGWRRHDDFQMKAVLSRQSQNLDVIFRGMRTLFEG